MEQPNHLLPVSMNSSSLQWANVM